MWALLTLACVAPPGAPGTVPEGSDSADTDDIPDTPDTADTDAKDTATDAGGPDTGIESVPGDDSHPFLREDVVHELVLTLSPESWEALAADGGSYVPATLDDGSVTLEVGVRIKGWTSAQPLTGKPSFKVDLDRFVEGQRYHELEAFDLHAELTDAAALSEWLAYRLFRDQGLPASRTGWAHLALNDEDYGFYTVVEKKDDQLIEHWWSDTSGSLYESSSESWPCDLDNPGCACFEVDEEGTGDSRADLERLCEVATGTDDADWLAAVSALVPMEAFTRFMATEIFVGAHDHYAGFSGNFYLYHEPATDQWWFIPSSMNNQFGSSSSVAPTCTATSYGLPDYRHGLLADRCQGDATCAALLDEALVSVAGSLRDSGLLDDIPAVAALIAPYVAADPRSPWTIDQFEGQVACIQDWLAGRAESLGIEPPEDCLGTGEDLEVLGVGTLSANQRCDRVTPEAPVFAVAAVTGTRVTLEAAPEGLAEGDEALLMVVQAAAAEDVGVSLLAEVVAVDGDEVQLAEAAPSLSGEARWTLQRVPTFRHVHVGPDGMLTTAAWDGSVGGVLAFRATGTVRIEAGGRITMSGRGYRGGPTGPSSNTDGYQGESLRGTGSGGGTPHQAYNASGGWYAANLGGGGAMVSGGGGEHAGGATAGTSWNGEAPPPAAGEVQGAAELSQPLMGSGGGGVAQIYDTYGPGGAGGGIVLIWAGRLEAEGEGALASEGQDATAWTRGTWTYGAGGGAGGSMHLVAEALELTEGALQASGGSGYTAVDRPGGQGGAGRIRVDCETLAGISCAAADWTGLADPAVGFVGATD